MYVINHVYTMFLKERTTNESEDIRDEAKRKLLFVHQCKIKLVIRVINNIGFSPNLVRLLLFVTKLMIH